MKCKNCSIKITKGEEIIGGINKFCSKSCKLEFGRKQIKVAKEKQVIKQKKKKDKKHNSIPTLKKLADKYFSLFIRKRDALLTTGTQEKGACITCGKINEIKLMDCGHFISRIYTPTRWLDKNANLQCKYCNGPMKGRQFEHGEAIDRKYGKGTSQEILSVSKGLEKLTQEYLLDVIKVNKEKLENL